MKKCNICGKRFRLLAKNRYEVVKRPAGLNCLTEGTVYYRLVKVDDKEVEDD